MIVDQVLYFLSITFLLSTLKENAELFHFSKKYFKFGKMMALGIVFLETPRIILLIFVEMNKFF